MVTGYQTQNCQKYFTEKTLDTDEGINSKCSTCQSIKKMFGIIWKGTENKTKYIIFCYFKSSFAYILSPM